MTGVRYVRSVRFQVLGPVRVTADGRELPLGGPQQRLVLALLIAAGGRTVSTSSLVNGIWGESLPPTARKALQGYVHHLRGAVGDLLVTEARGYSLETSGDVDAIRFEELREEAAALLGSDPSRSSELLREGLGMWSGSAYADLSDQHALLPEVARLENLRLVAVGDRIDADLALGRQDALIGELEGLTLEHPFHERFWAQHMTALYRAGRQTEALRSFERLRRFLADESGLEPSQELRSLEERILSQHPSLSVATDRASGPDPAAIRGYELRERIASDDVSETYRAYQRSVGRQVAVRIIGRDIANDPVFISNFLEDTKRVAAVDHPHISYVFDTWREPGKAYQVSRWLGGGSLDSVHSRGLSSRLGILANIGDALAHAHRLGVAHGAVDGSHVLFDDGGHPYLTGFSVGYPQTDADLTRDRRDFAALAHRVITGKPPLRVDGHLQPDTDNSALARVFEVMFSDNGYRRLEDFLRALRQAAGADVVGGPTEAPVRAAVRNPYKGLKAFQEADSADFFGRDLLIERLMESLESRRLVGVVGPSGSGKSSVVKAGLLPRLRSKSKLRIVTEMFPGAFPFEELEGALLRVGLDRTSLIEDLISDDRGLPRVLKQILPTDDSELILIIDQFEELFSTVDDERTRRLFLDNLINAVSEPRSRLRVVITMRADFFDRPLEHPRFGKILEAGLVPITLPDDDQLAQATVMPARSEGVEFEDGLVSQIVSDVSGQSGGLPLLQYALTEMYEARRSDVLTLSAYQRSGGVHGALGRRAEEIYQDLNPLERSAVREAFLRMVTVDEYANDLRRRVRRSDLSGIGAPRDLDNSLRAYAAARLVTFDRDPVTRGPTVEVAHEALLREWDRFRDWIEEQREDLVIRRRLVAAMLEWQDSDEDPSFLVVGGRLAQFDSWASTTQLALTIPERSYLEASREREEELQRKAGTRRRRVLATLSVAVVAAVAFGLFALMQRNQANQQAFDTETARLGNEAAAISDSNHQLSLLMAVEAFTRDPGFEGLSALQAVLIDTGSYRGTFGAANAYHDVRWAGDHHVLALSGDELHLIEPSTGILTSLSVEVSTSGQGIQNPASTGLTPVIDSSGALLLVDPVEGSVEPFPQANGCSAAALNPDGSLLASGYPDGRLVIHEVESAAEIAAISAFSPETTIEDLDLAENIGILYEHTFGEIGWIEFSPTGDRLVAAAGPLIRGWSAQDLSPVGPQIVHYGGTYESFSYIQDPRHFWFDEADDDVIVIGSDIFATKWRISSGEQVLHGTIPTGRSDPIQAGGLTGYADIGGGVAAYLAADGHVVAFDVDAVRPGGPQPPPLGVVLDTQQTQTSAMSVNPSKTRLAVSGGNGVVIGSLNGDRLIGDAIDIGISVIPTVTSDGSFLAAGLVDEGIFDLRGEYPELVDFAVAAGPIPPTEGHAGYYRFLPTVHDDVVMWESEYFQWAEAHEFPSGEIPATIYGSWIPSFSDDGSMLVRALVPEGGIPFDTTQSVVEEVATGMPIHTVDGWVRMADFTADGTKVAMTFLKGIEFTFGADLLGGIVLDLETGTETRFPEIPGGVWGTVFTPDGNSLFVVGGQGNVYELDAASMEIVRELESAAVSTETGAMPPAISPDGRFLASVGDGAARVWHLDSGKQLARVFPSEPGGIPYTVADSDALRLVTPLGGNALIWDLDTDSWADIACQAAGRNMTRAEWEQFGPRDTEYRATCSQYPIEPESVSATSAPETTAGMTEEEALSIVMAAFEAYNSGDFETWALWREGGALPDQGDGDYEVAAESRLDVRECTYRGYGEWMMDEPMIGHGFECEVAQTDLILAAAGIKLEMTYVWVIGEDPNSSLGGSNEDDQFVDEFMSEYRSWLAANHPEVEATIEYATDSDQPTHGGVRTALEFIDEFVAHSNVYPLTEPVAPVFTYVLTKTR